MTVEEFVDRLERVWQEKSGQYMARCPCHPDDHQSLAVSRGDDDRVLVRCLAGCETEKVVKTLDLTMSDLFNGNGNGRATTSKRQIVATYDYLDAQGELLFQTVRYEPKDFRQRRPDGHGGWIWDLKDVPRVLYRLRELIDADPAEWVLIVEGEKDADRLGSLGLVATTCPMGAGKWSKLADDSALDGRRVAIIPDKDDGGREHARDVAARLHGRAHEVRIVELPGNGKDASDWVDAGGTREQLRELIQRAKPFDSQAVARPGASQGFNRTDMGNAERLAHEQAEDLRYTDAHGWLVWSGTHWERDSTDAVEKLAKGTVRGMYAEAARIEDRDDRRRLAEWATRCEARKRITDMIALAKSDPAIRINADDLDTDPWLLNVQNGRIDLRDGELRQHDREDLITRVCPVDYDPGATAPRWAAFLDEIMDSDGEMIAFLQRAVGHSLTGDTSERCLFLLWGTGRNGKSTFLRIIREMLDGYALHARAETILAKRGDAVPCDLARLKGARLVTFSEVDEGRRMFVSRVKEMTGGTDPITARFMRQNEFTFLPEFKPWIATNHRPTIHDDSDAIWDRLFTIPFVVRVADDRIDKRLPEKLLGELPGVLRWAVEGCLGWQAARGLLPPEKVIAANTAYRTEMDTFAQWLDERCVLGLDTMQARGGELWKDYKTWCDDLNVRPMGSRKFGERLTERFRKEVADGGFRTYYGVGLRAEA